MNFPTEQVIVSLVLVLVLVSMVTCSPQERKCDVIHESASPLQKCEVW